MGSAIAARSMNCMHKVCTSFVARKPTVESKEIASDFDANVFD